jgi:HEAT repeat protein
MVTYFCPNCWNEFKENFKKCPACGYSIEEFERLSYEDKLIVALNHPVREFRMNAIRQLGNMRSERALQHFERIIDREDDIFTLMEIAEALSKIRSQKSLELLFKLAEHGSRVVSEVAKSH